MDLLGTPLFLLAIALAVATPIAALLLWGRVRGAGGVQVAQRLGLVVLCQLTAVLLASVALNREYVFYESWSDLFGQDDNATASVQATGTPHTQAAARRAPDGRER